MLRLLVGRQAAPTNFKDCFPVAFFVGCFFVTAGFFADFFAMSVLSGSCPGLITPACHAPYSLDRWHLVSLGVGHAPGRMWPRRGALFSLFACFGPPFL
jgi:hypothetical protein